MSGKIDYVVNEEIKFDFSELIDVQKIVRESSDCCFNQTLCKINDCVVRLGIFKCGIFNWHKSEAEDKSFFVLNGRFIIELENKEIVLNKHQGCTILKGVAHRPRVVKHATVIMVEGSTVKPIGG
ncbi:MAG: cupin domain-containing protein [Caldisericia bacterium]|nr:cupin domain-containing protein [Caldisericia bacterium]